MPTLHTRWPDYDGSGTTGSWLRSNASLSYAEHLQQEDGNLLVSPEVPGAWSCRTYSGGFLLSIDRSPGNTIAIGVRARMVSGTGTLTAQLAAGGSTFWSQNIALTDLWVTYTYTLGTALLPATSGEVTWTLIQAGIPQIQVELFQVTSSSSDEFDARLARRPTYVRIVD